LANKFDDDDDVDNIQQVFIYFFRYAICD